MTDFPRIEVSGDKDGGWLAEIHDGVFHHVFGDLTGANENEVKEAALARFAEAHPDTELGREVAAAAEKVRAEAEAKAAAEREAEARKAEAEQQAKREAEAKLRAAQAQHEAESAAQSPGEQRGAEIITGNEAQAEREAHEPDAAA